MPDYPIRHYKKTHQYTEDMREHNDREAYALIFKGGAIEGWRRKASTVDPMFSPTGYMGGIEVHSRTPRYEGHTPMPDNCDLLGGDTCYHDGSGLAFDKICHYFDNPGMMYGELAMWKPGEWTAREKTEAAGP